MKFLDKLLWNSYIKIQLKNPLRTYFKVRKWFNKLSIKVDMGKPMTTGLFPICESYIPKLFYFISSDLLWKNKYDSPRFEYPPHIEMIFFKRFKISIFFVRYIDKHTANENLINLHWAGNQDMIYWESALRFLYYKKSLQDSITYWAWNGLKSPSKKICLKQKYINSNIFYEK